MAVISILLGTFVILTIPPEIEVTACDVGQGDATLIRYGQSYILIDTGPNSAVLRCLQRNVFWLDRTLDAVVLTHPDKDHIGGWETVQQHYAVSQLFTNGQSDNPEYTSGKNVAHTGDLFKFPGLNASIVWSADAYDVLANSGESEEERNQRSVGWYMWSNCFGFLSLGDLECAQELAVTGNRLLSFVSLLKVSHHGSKSSTCENFLQKIQTEAALLSVGKNNSYNHPDKNVLISLEKYGVVVYRTDKYGEIHIFPHSKTWWTVLRERP